MPKTNRRAPNLPTTPDQTIFVSIASYRDVDCQLTLRDLFAQAAYPERIFAGVCWQWLPEADGDCFDIVTRPEQVREARYHISESRGACWARAEAQKLWQGEDYVLQIDAHHRFARGWDVTLIDLLQHCPSAKPVISTIAMGYRPPRDLSTAVPGKTIFRGFDQQSRLPVFFSNLPIAEHDIAARRLLPNPFICGHFFFGPAIAMAEVPWDPHIHMKGDEITRSVRFWSHGWDCYAPSEHILWHDWRRQGRAGGWRDEAQHQRLIEEAHRRVRHLLGIETSNDPDIVRGLDQYGFGQLRSVVDFQAHSGIDFRRQAFGGPAATGDFPPYPGVEKFSPSSA